LKKDDFYRVLHGEIDDYLPKTCLTNFDAATFEQKWDEVRPCDLISNDEDGESFSGGGSCTDLEVSVNKLSLNNSKIIRDYEKIKLNKQGYTITSSDDSTDSDDSTSSGENHVQINSDSVSGPEIDPDIDPKYRKFIPQLKKVHTSMKSLGNSEKCPQLHDIKKRLLKDSFSSDTSSISKKSDEIDSLENIIWHQNTENHYDNPTPNMNFCEVCRFSFSLKTHISQHENSKKHKNTRKQLINRKIIDPNPLETPIIQTITEINSYCEVCNFSTHYRGKFDKKLHEKTKWHKQNAKFYVSGTYLCNPCKKRVRDVHKVSHEASLEHRRNGARMEPIISMHFCEMCQMSVPVEDRDWHEGTNFHKENAGKFGKSLRSAGKVDPMDFVNFGYKRDRYESSTPIKCGNGKNGENAKNGKNGENAQNDKNIQNSKTSQNPENEIVNLDETESSDPTDNTPKTHYCGPCYKTIKLSEKNYHNKTIAHTENYKKFSKITENIVQIPTSLIDATLPDRLSQIKISLNSDRIKNNSPEKISITNIYAKLRPRTSSNSSDSVQSCKLYVMAVNNHRGNFSSNSENLTPVKLGSSFTNGETTKSEKSEKSENNHFSTENNSTPITPSSFKKIRRSASFTRTKSPLTKQFNLFSEKSSSGVHLIGDKEVDVNAVISLKVKQELLDEDQDLKNTAIGTQQMWPDKQKQRYKDRIRRVCSSPRVETFNKSSCKSLNKSVNEREQNKLVRIKPSISDNQILIKSSE